MIELAATGTSDDLELHALLRAYRDETSRAKALVAEFDGWTPRLRRIDGVDAAALPRMHGRLIAQGLLQFQLADRHAGMQYQLTLAGRRALGEALPATDDDPEADDADDEASN